MSPSSRCRAAISALLLVLAEPACGGLAEEDAPPEVGADDSGGDGFDVTEDCDDGDAGVNPGEDEAPYDGVDNDCDPGTPDDADGDGYPVGKDCDDDAPWMWAGSRTEEGFTFLDTPEELHEEAGEARARGTRVACRRRAEGCRDLPARRVSGHRVRDRRVLPRPSRLTHCRPPAPPHRPVGRRRRIRPLPIADVLFGGRRASPPARGSGGEVVPLCSRRRPRGGPHPRPD